MLCLSTQQNFAFIAQCKVRIKLQNGIILPLQNGILWEKSNNTMKS